MSLVNFIDFNTDKSTALSIRTSPLITVHTFTGIQLLPNNPLPYIQTTNVSGGIELEDWEAFIVNLDTCEETDISEYFTIERNFEDDNGDAQFDWSLKNVPFDFGCDLVYLKVNQSEGETFYSNVFQFTEYESEKTCRLDYKDKASHTMQSIQVQMYFWQPLKNTEKGTYYEVSTRNTVTTNNKSQKYEKWITEFISTELWIKIDDVFENVFVYVDLIRCNLFEANEVKEHDAEADFEENIAYLSFFRNDVYDPLYVPSVVNNYPIITLDSVIVNGINAIYEFTLENFTPGYLVYQASQDQVTWGSKNLGITSPMNTSFNEVGTWYFRIIHPEAISNIIELELGVDVEAFNDTVQVVKGGTIDINALINDTLIGETLITAVGSAARGATSIIESGAKVRYVHDDSETTTDSFTYTISNGITSDMATVNITIVESTSFLMTFQASEIKETVCSYVSFATALTYYYATTGLAPTIGDRVFIDEFLVGPKTATQPQWHKVEGGKVIKLDTQGYIIEIAFC